ncbi:hypothetical protein DFJ74DRAFT_102007 [Hyaloraphidium curvatum]|nr:hypothetical protein DFJ74DRAFT_102007 [Hyaloraphidium curvatum]
MEIKGARVLVTGGTEGIGREIADRLLAQGARVAIANRNEKKGAAVVAELRARFGDAAAVFVPLDVCDPGSVRAAFSASVAALGALDAVVANAGFNDAVPTLVVAKAQDDAWMRGVAGNLVGFMLLGRLAATYWHQEKRAGVFVGNTSIGGMHLGNLAERTATAAGGGFSYAPTKAAQVSFVEGLQATMDILARGRSRVRCAAVCPGLVYTPLLQEGLKPGVRRPPPVPRGTDPSPQPVKEPPRTKEQFARMFPAFYELVGGYTPIGAVADAVIRCITDESIRGQAFVVAGEDGESVQYPRPGHSAREYVRGKASKL